MFHIFKPIQEICKEFAMSRQAVVKNAKLFESIHYGKNLRNKLYRVISK